VKISYDQTHQKPLTDFGVQLVQMIKDHAYDLIADRFGYAMALDRPQADAIASDIERCLTEDGRSATLDVASDARILVKYFQQPNDANLFGLVECFLQLDQSSGELLAELIVTAKDNNYYVSLEDVSYAA
jgi:hypothetical protein